MEPGAVGKLQGKTLRDTSRKKDVEVEGPLPYGPSQRRNTTPLHNKGQGIESCS